MTGTHTALDHIFLVLITLVWPLVDWRWYFPRSVSAIAAGVSGARARMYRNIVLPEWGFTACIVTLWVYRGRSWAALLLGPSTSLRLGMGFALVAIVFGLLWRQRRAILARPATLAVVRRQLASADALIPRTTGERRGAILVSMTAGICEEFLFRGFVMWYFKVLFPDAWSGIILAVGVSSLLFGFAHIYLGVRQVWVTAAVGAAAALLVLAAGSLWPAIILHAAQDLYSFDLGYRALSGSAQGSEPPVPAKS